MTPRGVTVTKTCPCGTRFESQSPRAVYCSPTCRKRASRAGVVVMPNVKSRPESPPMVAPEVEVPTVTGAVIAELGKANAMGSPAGLAAVKLAQLIDSASLASGPAVSGWTREMRAALAEAKGVAEPAEADPIDELEKKRAARGA